MGFIAENWHLLLFGAVVVCSLAWDALLRRKPTTERFQRIIVLLAGTYGVAWTTQEFRHNRESEGNVDYFLSQLSRHADNEFARAVLSDYRSQLKKFTDKTTEANSESELAYQMKRALRSAKRSVVFVDQYILVWKDANPAVEIEDAAAVRRGVEVKRIFIISDSILRDRDQRRDAIDIMRKQSRRGVVISYALRRDLLDPAYNQFADVNYALFDNEVLAKIRGRASPIEPATYGVLMWGNEHLATDPSVPWLLSSGTVHPFDLNSTFPQ